MLPAGRFPHERRDLPRAPDVSLTGCWRTLVCQKYRFPVVLTNTYTYKPGTVVRTARQGKTVQHLARDPDQMQFLAQRGQST
jgi:hypothetical protein